MRDALETQEISMMAEDCVAHLQTGHPVRVIVADQETKTMLLTMMGQISQITGQAIDWGHFDVFAPGDPVPLWMRDRAVESP